MHETRPIINMILDTSLTLCKHKKKLKASRQLSEEIFRLHFIIFHYHCFTDASGQIGPNSQLLPKICFASFPQADYEIWKFHVNFGQFAGERCQQIFKISTSHTCPCQSSYQMAGWSAKAHFVNCQSCRDYSFSNYWTAQDVVNMRKELFFRSSSKDWRKSLQS